MTILGISAFYHDSAVCLLENGEITFAAQEERFTRIKHDPSFPHLAIKAALNHSQLDISDIDYIAFYDKPFTKFERLLESYFETAPFSLKSFLKAMPVWIKQKLWLKGHIQKQLGFQGEILFPEHHHSHAASAFFPSPFQNAAFLTIDGVGEWTTTSFGVGKGNSVNPLAELQFPHSLGLLYSAFTYYLGFKVNSGEYKVMGLAPYGEPKYKKLILEHLIDLKNDGSFHLNLDYFNFIGGLTMTNEKFHNLLGGAPRLPESKLIQRTMDLARSLQEVTEEVILRMTNHIYRQTKQKNLCLAGGVALNCVANSKVLKQGFFDNIWVQPAAGDAGGALGAALITWHQYLGKSRKADINSDFQQGSYLGPSFSTAQIEKMLSKKKAKFSKLSKEELLEKTANLISKGKVVGWFQGRMEYGPRALGNRSILGDARSPKMQKIMNLKIKYRESFRPFAPSVLEEYSHGYFQLDTPSPYMLLTADINPKHLKRLGKKKKQAQGLDRLSIVRSSVPAITHVDNSARLQTVSAKTNPLYHQLINKFYSKTDCPVLINTSFNVRGEPIVCSPEDAYSCFMSTEMDFLAIGPFLLDKRKQPGYSKKRKKIWQKTTVLD